MDRKVSLRWRGPVATAELAALHAAAFGEPAGARDWYEQLERHSLGWVTARAGPTLVGFVNVAWDGAVHAFLLDTMVTAAQARRGIGTELVRLAVAEARAAGCRWLHVDFEPGLERFYVDACGFTPTRAGLIDLHAG